MANPLRNHRDDESKTNQGQLIQYTNQPMAISMTGRPLSVCCRDVYTCFHQPIVISTVNFCVLEPFIVFEKKDHQITVDHLSGKGRNQKNAWNHNLVLQYDLRNLHQHVHQNWSSYIEQATNDVWIPQFHHMHLWFSFHLAPLPSHFAAATTTSSAALGMGASTGKVAWHHKKTWSLKLLEYCFP